jgi:ribosome-associated toxin RatA of RatAB toxin-antitoxin module
VGPSSPSRLRTAGTLLVIALLSAARPAGAADPIELRVERSGPLLQVRATIATAGSAELCYAVIADFDRLAEFIPGLRSSRIVSEPGQPLELRQVGETTLGLTRYTIDVTLALTTDPPRQISFTRVAGNLEVMDGRWQVRGDQAACTIDYNTDLQPAFWVPPLVGPLLVRRQVRNQLEGLRSEIDRRAGLERR